MEEVTKKIVDKYSVDVDLPQEALTETISQVSYNLVMSVLTNDKLDIQNSHRFTIFKELTNLGVTDQLDQCFKTIAQAIVDAYDPQSILQEFRKYEESTASDSATTRNSAVYFADIKISNLIAWSNKLIARDCKKKPRNMVIVKPPINDPKTNKKNLYTDDNLYKYTYKYESALATILPKKLIQPARPVKEHSQYSYRPKESHEPVLRSHFIEYDMGQEKYCDLKWKTIIAKDFNNIRLKDAVLLAAIKSTLLFQCPDSFKGINKERQRRIIELTFHLFVIESRLHPAAILHILLAFDLHEKNPKMWSLQAVMNTLPFIEEGSVPVSRNIQIEFGRDKKRHKIHYYYDGGRKVMDTKKTKYQKKYSENEFRLWNHWLDSKRLPKRTKKYSAAQSRQAQVALPAESQSQDAQPEESCAEIKMELNKLFKEYFGFDNCLV